MVVTTTTIFLSRNKFCKIVFLTGRLGTGDMKHIICLIDGTWVTAFARDSLNAYSNIFKLNLLLKTKDKSGNPQIAFYMPGMGSRTSPLEKIVGGIGRGLADLVEETYVDICSNYEDGDKIYLFGFSRGAVVARFVASLISRDGLYFPEYVDKFRDNFTMQYGRNSAEPEVPILRGKWAKRTKERKSGFVRKDVDVEFVGVFDTVFGCTPLSDAVLKNFEKSDKKVPKGVRHAVQILAADEKRLHFHPQIWSGMEGRSENRSLEQIWMPGVHGDIGGIYVADYIGNMALFTMMDRVLQRTDLNFERIESILGSGENILNNAESVEGSAIVINGYSGLRDHYLRFRGKPRTFGETDHSQRISNLVRHVNNEGGEDHSGITKRKLAVGAYKTIAAYEIDRGAHEIDGDRLGVYNLPI
jgi:uncharacterized protein (DUF2235 family)